MARSRRAALPRGRVATREVRREQLIRSTVDAIARRGFAETTLANVADGAGLSRGIVNFHFQSKDALLVETLRYLSEEYRGTWRRALERAGPSPAEKLDALVRADFDPAICNRKKIAVWHAFQGEAKSRPTYLELCGARDQEYFEVVRDLCRSLIEEGGYDLPEPRHVAIGLCAMSDGLWLHLLLNSTGLERDTARETCLAYLRTLFPRHFPLPEPARNDTP